MNACPCKASSDKTSVEKQCKNVVSTLCLCLCNWDLNLRACVGNPETDETLPSLIKLAASDPLITPVWSGSLWLLRPWSREGGWNTLHPGAAQWLHRGTDLAENRVQHRHRGMSDPGYSVTSPGVKRSSPANQRPRYLNGCPVNDIEHLIRA